jgi:hypothetical protein
MDTLASAREGCAAGISAAVEDELLAYVVLERPLAPKLDMAWQLGYIR